MSEQLKTHRAMLLIDNPKLLSVLPESGLLLANDPVDVVFADEAIAALAAKDARIAELEQKNDNLHAVMSAMELNDAMRHERAQRHEPVAYVLSEDGGEVPEVVEFDWPDYHAEGMGCGLEDRDIRDRYEAMQYGWDCAIDRCAEVVPDEPLMTVAQYSRIVAAKDAEIARLRELHENAHSAAKTLMAERATLMEQAAHWLEVNAPSGGCIETNIADELRAEAEQLRAQPARQVGGDELILGSQAAAIGVAHELLAWNRSHSTPPIVVGLEYWVAQEALRMARAALAPAAVVMPDKDEYHQIAFEIGGTEGGAYHFEADELDAFIARLNRRVIPVELLKRVRDTLEYWINRVDTRGMSKTDYNSWLALGHHSKAMTALRALLGKEGER